MFTHLSRLVPAFLTWLIPAFLNTLYSGTLLLSDSAAHLLVLSAALLGVLGNTHFLLKRLWNSLGYSLTLLLLSVVAFLLGDHHTLGLVDVVDLCVLRRLAHLILGRALLLTCCGASLLRHIYTHFLWHRHYIRHSNSSALLLVVCDSVGLPHGVTLLPGLIPALLIPNSLAHRMTGKCKAGSTKQTEQLKHDYNPIGVLTDNCPH